MCWWHTSEWLDSDSILSWSLFFNLHSRLLGHYGGHPQSMKVQIRPKSMSLYEQCSSSPWNSDNSTFDTESGHKCYCGYSSLLLSWLCPSGWCTTQKMVGGRGFENTHGIKTRYVLLPFWCFGLANLYGQRRIQLQIPSSPVTSKVQHILRICLSLCCLVKCSRTGSSVVYVSSWNCTQSTILEQPCRVCFGSPHSRYM